MIKLCNFCKKVFDGNKNLKYCEECVSKIPEIRKKEWKICDNCEKEFFSYKRTRFCSISCSTSFHHLNDETKIMAKCVICESEFYKKNKNHITCSKDCLAKHSKIKKSSSSHEYTCSNCKITYLTNYLKKNSEGINFCSKRCETEYKDFKNKKSVICAVCNNEFFILNHEKTKTCSKKCRDEYRSIFFVGENNPSYKKQMVRIFTCKACGKEFSKKKPKMSDAIADIYCSKKCSMSSISSSMTKPHVSICEILDKMKIPYETEIKIGDFWADIFVDNKVIEIMGEYWHGDPRLYSEDDLNEKQIKNIKKDFRKQSLITGVLGIPILYIWENEANKEKDMCLKLLEIFLENPENLPYEDSFNYTFTDGNLYIKNYIIQSYKEIFNSR